MRKKTLINSIIVPVGTIALASLLYSCSAKSSSETVKKDEELSTTYLSNEQIKTAHISSEKAKRLSLNEILKVNGTFHVPPQYRIELSAYHPGFVRSIPLIEGHKVTKGQTLLVLENPDYLILQKDYLTQWNKLRFLEADYKRQRELAKDSIASQRILQQTESDYLIAKATFSASEKQLQLIGFNTKEILKGNFRSSVAITSPINGYITTISVTNGQYIASNTPLITVVNLDHIHAEISVYEKDIYKLKVGQKVVISPTDSIGAKTIQGVIYLIGKEIRADKTIMVHVHLDEKQAHIVPGMYINAFIETDKKMVWALPENAVVSYNNKKWVFINEKKNDRKNDEGKITHAYHLVEVHTGIQSQGLTEIVPLTSLDFTQTEFVSNGTYSLLGSLVNTEEE